jgi:mono/diheme cytochrome c family protein
VRLLFGTVVVGIAAIAMGALTGCQQETSEEPPILLERNMYDSERYNPESYSQIFPDHRTMRTPVPGTISADFFEEDPEVATGLLGDKSAYVMSVPDKVSRKIGGMNKLVARGRERFNIYCAPCHSQTGDGKGMVVCKRDTVDAPCESRGFPPLPSYEDPRLRQMPDGQLFATISHGVRSMPAYGPQIPIADRWAIVTYVRALQLSQMAAAAPPAPEQKK